jgi:RNA polymerase sigma-70 factor (ECF subfamily)
MDDLSAIKRMKLGDISGLATLVERYQVEAARVAYLIVRDLAQADDIVQEAFLRLYRLIRNFDEGRPFAPYFMRIVANISIESAQRASNHEARFPVLESDTIDALPPNSFFDLEQQVEAGELREAVWDALQTLTPQQRAAIVLRYYFDYSEREVAEALDTPQGTVSWRLHRARVELGKALQSFWGAGMLSRKGDA